MSTTTDPSADTAPTPADPHRPGRRPPRGGETIDDWRPEDEAFWESVGRPVARRNLVWSIFSEHLGFSVWLLWSVSAAMLPKVGFDFTVSQLFVLVAIPNLVGSLIRLPYTFAVPQFGGRNWTVISALAAAGARRCSSPGRCSRRTRRTGCSASSRRPPASAAATSPARWPTSTSSTRRARRAPPSASTRPAATSVSPFIQFFLPIIVGGAGASGWSRPSDGGCTSSGPATCTPGSPSSRAVAAWLFMNNLTGARSDAARAAGGRAVQAHLGDVVPLHRHLRLVHRLLRRDAAADQDQLLDRRSPTPPDRHQLRLLRLPGRPRRARSPGRSAAGWPTSTAARGSRSGPSSR